MGSQRNLLHQPTSDAEEQPPPPPAAASSAHAADSRLEKVLSEAHLPFFERLWLASRIEFGLLFHLAAPAVMVYLINNAMSLSTRVFAGHLGNLQLAAASLGNSGIQLCAYGLMVQLHQLFVII